ncbi:MAG: sensor histidine kinase [Acetobacteraceae bacterium]|nr:sensor histidine kinase [Acetobacteraceae bacterium]
MILRYAPHVLFGFSHLRALPVGLRYAGAALLVALALGVRLVLLGPQMAYPCLPFVPIVVLSAALFDFGSGLFAALLASSALLALDIAPAGAAAGQIVTGSPMGPGGLAAFLGISLLTASLVEVLHRTMLELATTRDALERTLREAHWRGVLLDEAAHRSRNDLQALSGLLRKQARIAAARAETNAAEALETAAARAAALARLGALIASSGPAAGAGSAEAGTLLRGIGEGLRAAIIPPNVTLEVTVVPHPIPASQARALGLLVHELVTNAAKYAFPQGRSGTIRVSLARRGEDLVLGVEDDGVGLDTTAPPRGTGLGQRLARCMATELGGRLRLDPGGCGRGTRWELAFPAPSPESARVAAPTACGNAGAQP